MKNMFRDIKDQNCYHPPCLPYLTGFTYYMLISTSTEQNCITHTILARPRTCPSDRSVSVAGPRVWSSLSQCSRRHVTVNLRSWGSAGCWRCTVMHAPLYCNENREVLWLLLL